MHKWTQIFLISLFNLLLHTVSLLFIIIAISVVIFCYCVSLMMPGIILVQLKDRYDILPHIYESFGKSKIARLCQELARCKDYDVMCMTSSIQRGAEGIYIYIYAHVYALIFN